MSDDTIRTEDRDEDSSSAPKPAPEAPKDESVAPTEREIGGRDGPDPTRFGDWEKNGRCIDF